MMDTVYAYIKKLDSEIIYHLTNIFPDFIVNKVDDNILKISFEEMTKEDILGLNENLMQDFYVDATIYVENKEYSSEVLNEILKNLKNLNSGVYYINDIILQSIKFRNNEFLFKIKEYFKSKLSNEYIETIIGFIENDLSASKTSKNMYMHRNTVNYRIDTFINITGIDVRRFLEAISVYLLFK